MRRGSRRVWRWVLIACSVVAVVVPIGLGLAHRSIEYAGWEASIAAVAIGLASLMMQVVRDRKEARSSTPEQLDSACRKLRALVKAHWRERLKSAGAGERDSIEVPWRVDDGTDLRSGSMALTRLGRSEWGRIVIVGGPGSGKSTLAAKLAMAILDDDGPVPVVLSLAGWNPASAPLGDWIAAEIGEVHPLVAEDQYGPTVLHDLVEFRRVLPVLDGLDEMAASLRDRAWAEIDATFEGSERVVVTCQTNAFTALRTGTIRGDDVRIRLEPVRPGGVVAAFERHVPASGPEWGRFFSTLRAAPETPLEGALGNPFILDLARTTYRDEPTAPTTLLRMATADREAVQDELLETFLKSAFAGRDRTANTRRRRYDVDDAKRWLCWLARRNTVRFAWWRLADEVPAWSLYLMTLMVVAAAAVAVDVVFQAVIGLLTGTPIDPGAGLVRAAVVYGVIALFAYRLRGAPRLTYIAFRGRWPLLPTELARHAPDGLAACLLSGVAAGVVVWLAVNLLGAVLVGLVFGLTVGVAVTLVAGVEDWLSNPLLVTSPTTPDGALRAERLRTAALAPLVGLVTGTLIASLTWVFLASESPPGDVVAVAMILGLMAAVAVVARSTWWRFRLACLWLAARGRLPWRLMAFLRHCHENGILRQAGATYEFRHRFVGDWLAGGRGRGKIWRS
ncbi:NACHT domain-containing protein [Actinoplanes sp. NPDC000266]